MSKAELPDSYDRIHFQDTLDRYADLLFKLEKGEDLGEHDDAQFAQLQGDIFTDYLADPEQLFQELIHIALAESTDTNPEDSQLEQYIAIIYDIVEQRPDLTHVVIPADRLPTQVQTDLLQKMTRYITPSSVRREEQFERVHTALERLYTKLLEDYFEQLLADYDMPMNLAIGLHNTLIGAWQTLNWRSVAKIYEIFTEVVSRHTTYEPGRDGRAILPFNGVKLRNLEYTALTSDLRNIGKPLVGFDPNQALKKPITIASAIGNQGIYDQVPKLIGLRITARTISIVLAGLSLSHQIYSQLVRITKPGSLGIEETNLTKKKFLSQFHPRESNSLVNALSRLHVPDDPILYKARQNFTDPEQLVQAFGSNALAELAESVQNIGNKHPTEHGKIATRVTELLAKSMHPEVAVATARELLAREQELRDLHGEMEKHGFHTVSRIGDRFSANRNPHLHELRLEYLEFRREIRYRNGDPEQGIQFAGYFVDIQLAGRDIFLEYFLSDDDRLLLNITYNNRNMRWGHGYECNIAPVWDSSLKHMLWEHIASIRLGEKESRSRRGQRMAMSSAIEGGSIVTPFLRLNQDGHRRTTANETQMVLDGYFTMPQLEAMEAAHNYQRSVSYVHEYARGGVGDSVVSPREMVFRRASQ